MQKIQQFWGQRWLTAHTLNLPAHWHQLWAEYTNALALSHVRIKDCEDELLWIHSKKEYYTPKEGYLYAYASKEPEVMDWWWKLIWKLKSPPKAKLFLWCLLTNKIPTGENLERRFFSGGLLVSFTRFGCGVGWSFIFGLSYSCADLELYISGFTYKSQTAGESIIEAWKSWWNEANPRKLRNIPVLIFWGIRIDKNRKIFQEKVFLPDRIAAEVIAIIEFLTEKNNWMSRLSPLKLSNKICHGVTLMVRLKM